MEKSFAPSERPFVRANRWLTLPDGSAALVGVFALSLALRVAVTLGFDGLYGQDPYAYYNYAGQMRAAISDRADLAPFFWPLGYPALLALAFALFGTSALVAQALTILLGALLASLVFVLARQVGASRFGALAAALIVAFCGQAIQSSIVVMADIPALFWTTLSAVALAHYLRGDRPRWLVVAALTLALACVTRWLYLALVPVWLAALLLYGRRLRWREIGAAGVAAALVLLPQIAVSIHSPFPVLNHAWVQGWSPANVLVHEFVNYDGHFVYADINALFYARPYFDAYYLAPLFTPFIVVGAWRLRRKPAWLALLLGWALLPYLFLAGIPYQNIRFPLIVFPAVAVLVGVGLDAVLHWNRLAFAALLLGGLALTAAADKPIIDTFIANQNRDKRAVQWAVSMVPPDARLYTFELTQPLKAYAPCDVRELYDETPQTITAALADDTPSYLFVNVWVIENQWAGRGVDVTYRWLRDTIGLEYLNRSGNYILFRIVDEYRDTPAGLQFPRG